MVIASAMGLAPGCGAAPETILGFSRPPDGAILTGHAPVSVYALGGAELSGVEVMVDGGLVGTAISQPYELTLPTLELADGPHLMVAHALGVGVDVWADLEIGVDNAPPVLVIRAPAEGASFAGGEGRILLAAEVADPAGPVRVRFSVDGRLVARLDGPPYRHLLAIADLVPGPGVTDHQLWVEAQSPAGHCSSQGAGFTVEIDEE